MCVWKKNDTLLVLEIVIDKCDMHFFIAGEMENAFSNDREQGQDDSYAKIRASNKRKLQCLANGKKYFHCGT